MPDVICDKVVQKNKDEHGSKGKCDGGAQGNSPRSAPAHQVSDP
jgi:hypothetical protein